MDIDGTVRSMVIEKSARRLGFFWLCVHRDFVMGRPEWPQRETRPRAFCVLSRIRLKTDSCATLPQLPRSKLALILLKRLSPPGPRRPNRQSTNRPPHPPTLPYPPTRN